MSKQEDRERKATQWLGHLQGWKDSQLSLAAYARSQGLSLWSMYQWRNVLRVKVTGPMSSSLHRLSPTASKPRTNPGMPLHQLRFNGVPIESSLR